MYDFNAMRNVDIRTVDRDTLVDINAVRIDESLPQPEKILQYIRQIGNPYCYRCGDVVIKERFSDNGRSLNDCLEQYIGTLI